jgi:hypothetical protein
MSASNTDPDPHRFLSVGLHVGCPFSRMPDLDVFTMIAMRLSLPGDAFKKAPHDRPDDPHPADSIELPVVSQRGKAARKGVMQLHPQAENPFRYG